MKNNCLLLTLIFVLYSCSSTQKNKVEITAVDLGLDNNTTREVELENDLGSYGPIDDSKNEINQNNEKSLSVLILPGMYRSMLAVDVLKCFDMNNIKINVISGVEFSSIIAALYAQGKSPEEIKWLLFNKARELKALGYSEDWVDGWNKFVNEKIQEDIIKSSQKSFWLYKNKNNKKSYFAARNIIEEIILNYDVNNENYSVEDNFLTLENLESFPTNKLIIINPLPKKLSFDIPSEFLIGHYGRLFSYVYKNKVQHKNVMWVDINSSAKLDDPSSRVEIEDLKKYCINIFNFYNG